VAIGAVLLIILTAIFIRSAGSLTGWMDYFIASIVVGFIVGENIYSGMFNGLITSLIGGIIVLFIEILILEGNYDPISLILILIFTFFIIIFMGITGGLIGSFLSLNILKNFPEKTSSLSGSRISSENSRNFPVRIDFHTYPYISSLLTSIKGFVKSLFNSPNKQDRVLKCTSCGGVYILQSDELPGDFESCSCGRKLDFYDSLGRKRPFTTNYPKEKKEMSLGTKILILIVVVIFALYYVFPYFMFSIIDYVDPSVGIYLFPIFFAVSIAVILILIWYAFIRK